MPEFDLGLLLKQFLNGASFVLFLILIAMGLSIIFGMMGVINMAHGEFFMLGAYVLLVVQDAGGSFWLGLFLAPIVVAIFGWAVERLVLRRLYGRYILATVLATWGFGLILRQVIQLIFSATPREIVGPISGSLHFLGITYPAYRLFLMGMSLLVVLGVTILFNKTRFGVWARATIQDQETASALGVNTSRMFQLTFALGSALAGIAGALMSPLISVTPGMGIDFIVRSFFVVIVGGLGTIVGVLWGGVVVGEIESISNIFYPPTVSQAVLLGVVIVFMLLRPRGIVGKMG
ncbi:MAG: branched-chain amino acid ABC transporter permease [Nitrospinota bacterium]